MSEGFRFNVIKNAAISVFFTSLSDFYNLEISSDWLNKIANGENIITRYIYSYRKERELTNCLINREWLIGVGKQLQEINIPYNNNKSIQILDRYRRFYMDILEYIQQHNSEIIPLSDSEYDYIVQSVNILGPTIDNFINYINQCKLKLEKIYNKYLNTSKIDIKDILQTEKNLISTFAEMQLKIINNKQDCIKQFMDNIIPPDNHRERCCAICFDNQQCRRRVALNSNFCEYHRQYSCDLDLWYRMLQSVKSITQKFNELIIKQNKSIINFQYSQNKLHELFWTILKVSIEFLKDENVVLTPENLTDFILSMYFASLISVIYRRHREMLCFSTQCARPFNKADDIGHKQAITLSENIYNSIGLFLGIQTKFIHPNDINVMIYIITDLQLSIQNTTRPNHQAKNFYGSSFHDEKDYNNTIYDMRISLRNTLIGYVNNTPLLFNKIQN